MMSLKFRGNNFLRPVTGVFVLAMISGCSGSQQKSAHSGAGEALTRSQIRGKAAATDQSHSVNLLLRGQSNAYMMQATYAVYDLATRIESATGLHVNVLADTDNSDGAATIFSGTEFQHWAQDGQQQQLLNFIDSQPADIKATPTLVLWMHNEYDGNDDATTSQSWQTAFEADKRLVEQHFGHSVQVFFEWVPYIYGSRQGEVQNAMNAEIALGNALSFDTSATRGAVMDGDGVADGVHLGHDDCYMASSRLAPLLSPFMQKLSSGAPQQPSPTPSPSSGTSDDLDGKSTSFAGKVTGKCTDVQWGSTSAGAIIQEYDCNGTGAQKYTLVGLGNGVYNLKTNTGSDLCLDANSDAGTEGVQMIQNSCSQDSNRQKFKVIANSDGTYMVSTMDGRCMDIWGGNSANETVIATWNCSASNTNQIFYASGLNGASAAQ